MVERILFCLTEGHTTGLQVVNALLIYSSFSNWESPHKISGSHILLKNEIC
jgi:hypothetical protein